jgi:hypothetical protein
MQIHVRVAIQKPPQLRRQIVRKNRGNRAQPQRSAHAIPRLVESVGQRRGVFDQGLRLAQNRLSQWRQLDAPVQAFKQRRTQSLFETRDLVGKRGLRDAQIFSSFGETARPRHRAEIL